MTDLNVLFDTYRDSVKAKDAARLLTIYDPAIRSFDLWGPWIMEGKDAFSSMVQEWFGSLGDEIGRAHV